MSFKPTEEQIASINLALEGKPFKVEAVAGSGKTSTVKLMAEALEGNCLYLAFNKAAASEAASKMPFTTSCRTTHSIAYAKFGAPNRDKLSRPKGGYVNVAGTVKEITRLFKVTSIDGATANVISRLAKQTVACFESSALFELSESCLPLEAIYKLDAKAKKYAHAFSVSQCKDRVLIVAKKLWAARIDLRSPVQMSHDTYLKLYQLSKPHLDYDAIFLDEAQDTSDCVIDIVMRQKDHAQVIAVGDSFQAIYGWRGAVNALAKIKSKAIPLSQSFRYGPRVATVATQILDSKMVVRGFDKIDTLVQDVDTNKPYTHLFRTNVALIKEGVTQLQLGKKVKIDADIKGFLRLLDSMEALRARDKRGVKHEDIVIFDDWEDLVEEADASGGELKLLYKLLNSDNYHEVRKILASYSPARKADVTLTTAHKSKGMEYEQVILAEDFPCVLDEEGNYTELHDMERNLLYVAATRATLCLQLNQTTKDIIERREDVTDWGETITSRFKEKMVTNLKDLEKDCRLD